MCLFFQGSQLYAHLTTSEYSGPEINFYSSGKINLASEHEVSGVVSREANCHVFKMIPLSNSFTDNRQIMERTFLVIGLESWISH